MEKYRELQFGTGKQRNPGTTGQRVKRGISKKRLEEVMANKGKLTR